MSMEPSREAGLGKAEGGRKRDPTGMYQTRQLRDRIHDACFDDRHNSRDTCTVCRRHTACKDVWEGRQTEEADVSGKNGETPLTILINVS